ncbi:MAG TPA: hypothetical protein VIA06_14660 [Candidatus Dormibacteraeota bacterium]|jgi:hypothetical protein|nr:hypothetical protein [Candidatus Dormibacteraeota bacterium]
MDTGIPPAAGQPQPAPEPRARDPRSTVGAHVQERLARLEGTKNLYDRLDKLAILASILFGVGTTVTAAAGLRIEAVALAALVTGTISAQHWFALGPRARSADLTVARLRALGLKLETELISPADASTALGQIDVDYVSGRPAIGTEG